MARPGGALQRSLGAMTVGVVKGMQAKEEQLARTELGDMAQHTQVDIEGRVGKDPYTFVAAVEFQYPFVYAPAQHDSDLETPHFNCGIELGSGQGLPAPGSAPVPTRHPVILCDVSDWIVDGDGFTIGANIAVTAWIPGAKKKRQFSATAHITFWGYGAPNDNDEQDDAEDES